jgi:hypothetical protein
MRFSCPAAGGKRDKERETGGQVKIAYADLFLERIKRDRLDKSEKEEK